MAKRTKVAPVPAAESTIDNESLYRAVFENMSEGVALCRIVIERGKPRDFVYLRVNAAFERLTGLSNVAGRKVSDVIPGIRETSPELFETYGRVAATGEPEQFETFIPGLVRWFQISAYCPAPGHFVAVFSVITDRKKSEAALQLFRALIDQSRDAIEVVDPKTGRYIDVNERGLRQLGYDRHEFLALSVPNVDPTVDATSFAGIVAELREAGVRTWPGIHRRKDGSTFPVEIGVSLVQLDQEYLIAVVSDVTDRRRAEAELRLQGAALNAAANAVVITDREGAIAWVNPAFTELTGYRAGEALGKNPRELVKSGVHDDAFYRGMWETILAGKVWRGRMTNRRKDGSLYYEEQTITPVKGERGEITHFIAIKRDLTTERRLEERYRSVFDGAPLGLFVTTASGAILEANPELLRILDYPDRDALLKVRAPDIYAQPADRERYLSLTNRDGVVRGFATVLKRRDGTAFPVELSARAVKDAAGNLARIEGTVTDVSDRQSLEAQLVQAQKMEAVGLLAGGIAHDFNNLLGAITMFGELAAADLPEGDTRREDLDSIQEAVARATTLTRQLLTFSRQQVVHPKVLDPNVVIADVLKILGRLIGEDIELITELDRDAGLVLADESQLEQVLMNLAVNARDAMPSGGKLTISTSRVHLDELMARVKGLEHGGHFLVLSVADTGTGMPADVQAHAFEPFFTTKGAKGTGLGLATVYGIVKQSGGHVGVASEPGRGTTFMIHLPVSSGLPAEHETIASQSEASGGTETVLVVEDDPAVRLAVSSVLSRLGYTLLVARTAEDALLKAREHSGPIDLILSDVVMPGMDGPDLIREIWKVRPDSKALLTSGYAGDAIGQHRVTESNAPFLEKPFTAASLAQRVRQVLDGVPDVKAL
ncbi:MAG: PAS domain S-box protein [Gemmatimonadales bacterium]